MLNLVSPACPVKAEAFDPDDIGHLIWLLEWLKQEEQVIDAEDVISVLENRHHSMYAAEFVASLAAKGGEHV